MKETMNTAELKKLAENAAENGASIYHEFYAAAKPAVILNLLAINAELVGALKLMVSASDRAEGMSMFPTAFAVESLRFQTYDARTAANVALAKAEGGEL